MRTKNRRRRNRQTEYWVFKKPNQMKDHLYTDDVALCKAQSKTEAYNLFYRLYANVEYRDIYRLLDLANYKGVTILTDY